VYGAAPARTFPRMRMTPGIALLLAFAGWPSAREPRYSIEVLPTPPDCESFSLEHGLTRQWVVGMVACLDSPGFRAVRWSHEGVIDLGTFGGPSSYPYAVDVRGRVVGAAETPDYYGNGNDHETRPFLWSDGALQELPTLGGHIGSGLALGPRGEIVGACQAGFDPAIGREPMRACVWADGAVRDLGDLGGPDAWAYDINARGWIAGSSGIGAPPAEHAFLVDDAGMHDLGTLGGPASIPFALNDRGDVVGFSAVPPPPQQRGTYHAFLWHEGRMHDLGTLNGTAWSQARDVNNRGEVVGTAFGGTGSEAVLWDASGIHRLADLVPDSADWAFQTATSIDDSGRILVTARRAGRYNAVVLVPGGRPPEVED